ncbi:hypothetical protein AL038_18120 [Beggiatoa leptomitoformis]|uniref:DUF4383 domain-containing protein n=1 Tax=Beggiatoa leptomitoformis TaxID=288004 RepID=A0A2N9YD10_9GAMM|nr:hypothetical protein AL038_18120 [Beggiatoa leptomitoformis]AUI68314.2 hypothetical protein BLE401_06095 [Beggiatoa leptomitoformis]
MQRELNLGRFFIGLIMMIMGGYLFLKNIHIGFNFALAYSFGSVHLTAGYVLIPFIFGIGMVFYNPDNDIGWLLIIITFILVLIGVINSISLVLNSMSAFDLMMILGLMIGGVGVFLSSLLGRRKSETALSDDSTPKIKK